MGALTRALVLVAVLAIIGAMGVVVFAVREMAAPLPLEEATPFEIASGQGMNAVSAELNRKGIVEHPRILALYARAVGLASSLKAGEYLIEPGQTSFGLLEQFVTGRVLLHSVTLIEGWTFREALIAIREHPAVRVTGESDPGARIVRELGLEGDSAEGWLLPETYAFPRGTSDVALLRMAAEAMREQLRDAWDRRGDGLPIEEPYEALILASIIEKETGLASERPQIAGVFSRRLERGMRLQTDPTVIYGLGAAFDGNLRRADLERDTPYNTYTRSGLPPTPIALPGRGSLDAAVRPAEGEALYFVATGEPDGSHYFSRTLEEHNKAVRRYLARRRQQEEE
jgi:UPF0755 protein